MAVIVVAVIIAAGVAGVAGEAEAGASPVTGSVTGPVTRCSACLRDGFWDPAEDWCFSDKTPEHFLRHRRRR